MNAIANLHIAIFMVDDFGDPSGYFIENNDGRVFHDSDSLSEKISGFPKRSAGMEDLVMRTISTVGK